MYFTIYQDSSGQWRWNLKSANHQIIASGEAYRNKTDCLHAIGLIRATNIATPIRGLF